MEENVGIRPKEQSSRRPIIFRVATGIIQRLVDMNPSRSWNPTRRSIIIVEWECRVEAQSSRLIAGYCFGQGYRRAKIPILAYYDPAVISVFISKMHDFQGESDIYALFLAALVDATLIDDDALVGHCSQLVCPEAVPELVLGRWPGGIRDTSIKPDFGECTSGNPSSEFLGNPPDIVARPGVTRQTSSGSPGSPSQVVKVLPIDEDGCAHDLGSKNTRPGI